MAQTRAAPANAASSATAGEWVVERPPEGPAQGKLSLPAWGVLTLGSALVLIGLGYMLLRLRRRSHR